MTTSTAATRFPSVAMMFQSIPMRFLSRMKMFLSHCIPIKMQAVQSNAFRMNLTPRVDRVKMFNLSHHWGFDFCMRLTCVENSGSLLLRWFANWTTSNYEHVLCARANWKWARILLWLISVTVRFSHSHRYKHKLEINSNQHKSKQVSGHIHIHNTHTYRAYCWYPLCCDHRFRRVYARNEAQRWLSSTHARSAKTPSTLFLSLLFIPAVACSFLTVHAGVHKPYFTLCRWPVFPWILTKTCCPEMIYSLWSTVSSAYPWCRMETFFQLQEVMLLGWI